MLKVVINVIPQNQLDQVRQGFSKDLNNNTNNNDNQKPLTRDMVVNGVNLSKLKFVKPARQCFYWENRDHPMEPSNCRLWHPRELCK